MSNLTVLRPGLATANLLLMVVFLSGCEVTAPKNRVLVFDSPSVNDAPLPDVETEKGDQVDGVLDEAFETDRTDSPTTVDQDDAPEEWDATNDIPVKVVRRDTADDHDADHGPDRNDPEDTDSESDEDVEEPLPLIVEIHTSDMWGQRLDHSRVLLETEFQESLVPETGEQYLLPYAGDFRLSVSANDYEHAELWLEYDGSLDASGVTVWRHNDRAFGFVLRSAWADDETDQQVLHIHVGLPHRYFASSGQPIRHDGRFRFFMDGQTAWNAVHRNLENAEDHIHATAWWWESDFELIRPLSLLEPSDRQNNTILSVLQRSPATKRILLWSHPSLSQFNVDEQLIQHASQLDDIEVLGIHNETAGRFHWSMPSIDYLGRMAAQEDFDTVDLVTDRPVYLDIDDRWVDLAQLPLNLGIEHASFHQKTFVIDDAMAFVGGMNLKSTDWDTLSHNIYEPRRMYFDSDVDDRRSVIQRQQRSDVMPRKDYMVQLLGRIASDVNRNFQTLWTERIESGAPYAHNASEAPLREAFARVDAPASMQIVRTMPAPHHDYSVLETYLNAVRNANDYILIEDQYWRAPLLVDAIMSRMSVRPSLQLVVVTNDVDEWTDPGCFWTATTHQWLQNAFPDRYHAVRMSAFAATESVRSRRVRGEFQDIFIHSKLLIVDDIFMSVGSANTNHRGFLYEHELNVNVFGRRFVRPIRHDVISHLLGVNAADQTEDWIEQLNDTAYRNATAHRWWNAREGEVSGEHNDLPPTARPTGFAYPLHIRSPQDCFIESIGQDVTRD